MDHVQSAIPYDVGFAEVVGNFVLVAKPGIVAGNLVSAAAGFAFASKGRIDWALLAAALAGIGLVVAAGCVFNNILDKETDRKMRRTRKRVLARGALPVKAVLYYAILLAAAGAALLQAAADTAAVAVVLAGLAIYVVVYSRFLKRWWHPATLAGSLAGAAPAVAGYCAAGGGLDAGALMLTAILCAWQIPHFYAVSIFREEDYTAAGIPVPPARIGTAAARRHMAFYIAVFLAAAMMPALRGCAGPFYFTVVTATGLCWLFMAIPGRPKGADDRAAARALFFFSLVAIAVVSIMLSVDTASAAFEVNPFHLL